MENLIDDDIEVQQKTSAQPQTGNMRLKQKQALVWSCVIHHDFITVQTLHSTQQTVSQFSEKIYNWCRIRADNLAGGQFFPNFSQMI